MDNSSAEEERFSQTAEKARESLPHKIGRLALYGVGGIVGGVIGTEVAYKLGIPLPKPEDVGAITAVTMSTIMGNNYLHNHPYHDSAL